MGRIVNIISNHSSCYGTNHQLTGEHENSNIQNVDNNTSRPLSEELSVVKGHRDYQTLSTYLMYLMAIRRQMKYSCGPRDIVDSFDIILDKMRGSMCQLWKGDEIHSSAVLSRDDLPGYITLTDSVQFKTFKTQICYYIVFSDATSFMQDMLARRLVN
jgi:hypothetical protein